MVLSSITENFHPMDFQKADNVSRQLFAKES